MTSALSGSRFLLDTNVVIWLLLGDRDAIPEPVRIALADETNELFVSAVAVWEIAIKRSLGRLAIDDGWQQELGRLAFRPLPITSRHAGHVEELPWHHRDPFDRLLVAQAHIEDQVLVTSDPRLPAYDVATFWAGR